MIRLTFSWGDERYLKVARKDFNSLEEAAESFSRVLKTLELPIHLELDVVELPGEVEHTRIISAPRVSE